jgi:hypothetical protein
MTSMTFHSPVRMAAPRGALIAASLFGRMLGWIYSSAESRMRRRELNDRMTEACRVRAYAQQVMEHDPRFAADLFAAADRHERL